MPLANLIRDTAQAVVDALGLEQTEVHVEGLATRWQRGTLVMQPADNQFTRRGGLETFFHKIVMIRNNGSRAEGERERQTERSGHRSAAVPVSKSTNASAHSKNGMQNVEI
jgi:hypothetical protein